MFCPGCGVQAGDDLKFCRQCGANLHGAREGMVSRSTEEKFDWSKTWVADMFLTEEERQRRRGVTAEEKRLNEIKGGVITSFIGVGVMIFLRLFLDVVANQRSPGTAEILRSVWMAGIIPFMVGLGIIFNGLLISPRLVKIKDRQSRPAMPPSPTRTAIPSQTTNQLAADAAQAAGASVTEDTTWRLQESAARPQRREDD